MWILVKSTHGTVAIALGFMRFPSALCFLGSLGVPQPTTLVSVRLSTDCCITNGGSLGYILRPMTLQIVAGEGLGHVRRRKSGVEKRDVFSLSVVAEQVIFAPQHTAA